MGKGLSDLIRGYPRAFHVLVIVTFIDRLGGFLLFPFFSLYLTERFGIGMTTVGLLFGAWTVSGFLSSILGGALADRLGRKKMIIFSLLATSFSAIAMGLVNTIEAFFIVALVVGLFTDSGWPAYQAVVADLLPEERRASGFGLLRIAVNLSAIAGPMIGGFLAQRSYLSLFIADAAISLISAAVVYFALPETMPEKREGEARESLTQTFAGYGKVLRDGFFVAFSAVFILNALVYNNLGTTLGVYMRDSHGIPESGYGTVIALNGLLVVLFQLAVTKWTDRYRPMGMLALGTLLYGIGFGLYGVTSTFPWFLFAIVIVTLGEMIVVPISQSVSSIMAPEDMRGRYATVFGFAWGIPSLFGPYLSGLVMDQWDPRYLWYLCALFGTLGAIGFLALIRPAKKRLPPPSPAQGG